MKILPAYALTETSGTNGAKQIIGVAMIDDGSGMVPHFVMGDETDREYIPIDEVQVIDKSRGHRASADYSDRELMSLVSYRG